MKKVYLSLVAAAVTSFGFSQVRVQNVAPARTKFDFKEVRPENQINNQDRAIIWSDDCSVPGNWTLDNTSAPSLDWSHTTDVNAGPIAALNPAGFTTAANGYYIIDSDAAGATATQNANLTTANSIDLQLYPNVFLTFQQTARKYAETYTVRVSGDNGGSWTDFEVNADMDPNSNTTNPEVVSFDISAVAGGQSQVLIQFNYQGAFDFFWAIDDIMIETAPNDEFAIQKPLWGSNGPGLGGITPYYLIPTSQVTEVLFSSMVQNVGLNDQDITFDVDINSGASTYTSGVVNVTSGSVDSMFTTANFTPSGIGTYDIEGSISATRAGQVETLDALTLNGGTGYTSSTEVPVTGGTGTGMTVDITAVAGVITLVDVNYSGMGYTVGDVLTITTGGADATIEVASTTDVVTDQDPSDNSFSETIEVTNHVYARDNNIADGGSFNQGNAFEVGNGFDMFGDETLYSIEMSLNPNADASAGPILTYAVLYGLDQAGNFVYIAGSDEISITQAMIDNEETISYPFPGGISLTNGEFYLPVVGSYGNGGVNNELVIMTGGTSEPSTTFLYDPNEAGGTWFYTTSTPMVRMNFDQTTSVEENKVADFIIGQNVPNPFNNNSYINYSLNEASNVNFTVIDMTGKIVMDVNQGNQAAGEHRINLSADKFAEGVYFYSFTIGDKKVTKKMVVTK